MDEYETNRIKSLITLHEQIIEDKKEIILKLIDEISEEKLIISWKPLDLIEAGIKSTASTKPCCNAR